MVDTKDRAFAADRPAWQVSDEVDSDVLNTTVDACAWLIGIAEKSVELHGWDASIVRWLDQVGATSHAELQRRQQ